jgi:hypothetical protein
LFSLRNDADDRRPPTPRWKPDIFASKGVANVVQEVAKHFHIRIPERRIFLKWLDFLMYIFGLLYCNIYFILFFPRTRGEGFADAPPPDQPASVLVAPWEGFVYRAYCLFQDSQSSSKSALNAVFHIQYIFLCLVLF